MSRRYHIVMNYHFDAISRRGELSEHNIDLWKRDFALLRQSGFTGIVSNVVLWSTGRSGIAPYDPIEVQQRFLDVCQEAGLTVMLAPPLMHIPSIMAKLPDEKRYAGVDMYGRALPVANVFNARYRKEFLGPFLREIIHRFGHHPAVESYCFGDHFVGSASGFSPDDRRNFILFLRRKYRTVSALNRAHQSRHRSFDDVRMPRFQSPWTPLWRDFTSARRQWLIDYVMDLDRFVRRYDRNRAHRIPFGIMSWDLLQDKNDFGGISAEYLNALDVIATSLNFPAALYPRSLAFTLTDWFFGTIRRLCPHKEIGVGDIPGVRNQAWQGAGVFPSAKEIIALLERTLRYDANWFIIDGHRKSLQQTAVAYHQVYAFHKRNLRELGAFFKSLG